MAFDFSVSPRVAEWRDPIRTFVGGVVVGAEQDVFAGGLDDTVRRRLQAQARQAGVWAPQAEAELGGGGFRFDEVAVLLEEAGRSLLGPLALRAARGVRRAARGGG